MGNSFKYKYSLPLLTNLSGRWTRLVFEYPLSLSVCLSIRLSMIPSLNDRLNNIAIYKQEDEGSTMFQCSRRGWEEKGLEGKGIECGSEKVQVQLQLQQRMLLAGLDWTISYRFCVNRMHGEQNCSYETH